MLQALKAGPVSPQSDLPRELDGTCLWWEGGRCGAVPDRTANGIRRSNSQSLLLQASAGWRRKSLFAPVRSSASDPRAPQREDLRSELWQAGSIGTVLWSLHFYTYFIFIVRDAVP